MNNSEELTFSQLLRDIAAQKQLRRQNLLRIRNRRKYKLGLRKEKPRNKARTIPHVCYYNERTDPPRHSE